MPLASLQMPPFTEHTYRLRRLVRDHDVASMEADGARCEWHATDDEFQQAQDLDHKMLEEAWEISNAPRDKLANELIDMLELIYTRARLAGITVNDLEWLRAEKAAKRGSFGHGVFVSRVTCPVESKWDNHFAAQPGRYGADHKHPVPLKPLPGEPVA